MIVNGTETPFVSASSSPVGLAVGLTLFFLLLMIGAGVIMYKYQNKIRNILQSGQRRSPKKEDYPETTEADSHHYTSMIREPSAGQGPIYENLTTRTRPADNHSRPPAEPEDDLYLACDSPDDAIYSNDPECNLAISQEEDVYIMPDS